MNNFPVDPRQLIQMIRNGYNPQQLMLSILENQAGATPIGANLLNLARQGRTAEIEQLARNLVAESGGDFDTEFNAFKQSLGL